MAIDADVLDDPVGRSLRTSHAHLARRVGSAATYLPEVATFAALPGRPTSEDWSDLASLLGPGKLADLFSAERTPPQDWAPVFSVEGVQMVAGENVVGGTVPAEEDLVRLGAADVPDMLRLAELARPGPFWRRTIELGTYLGIRTRGELVAMAGERLRPPGWTEISAVCTAPGVRGRGHASALVGALMRDIAHRGERPFLHVAGHNTGAVRVYERLGFTVRRPVRFHGYRTPGP